MKRLFTVENACPYKSCAWRSASSILRNLNGSIVCSISGFLVPDFWSQISCDILAQKYFRKAGIPVIKKRVVEKNVPEWLQRQVPDEEAMASMPASKRYRGENSAQEVFDRLAGAWTYWGWTHNYFETVEEARTFFDEIRYMLCHQMVAPNSPQWFNTGLYWAYGITGPAQGHYYVDEITKKLTKSTNAYERPQPHACFIQSVKDDLVNPGGIMDLWLREARVFKYGSGTGSNFSNIRGSGEGLSGGGSSSGLLSFLKIGDTAAGAIQSGGTTRRAAKMVILDVDHPEIMQYINWKVREEQKVAALVTGTKIYQKHLQAIMNACHEDNSEDRFDIQKNPKLKQVALTAKRNGLLASMIQRAIALAKQGEKSYPFVDLNTDFSGEAYGTVSGQNSNNSVRVSNAFLEAVLANKDWQITERVSKKVLQVIPAGEIWHNIAKAAWQCADPGLQFDTTINEWHTCPQSGRIRASNPCSEYMFLDDTACNLASINLVKFLQPNTTLHVESLEHTIRLWTLVLEISVTMAQFPSPEIAEMSYRFRTLGLGYANLGSLLMRIGLPYDSAEGRSLCGAITSFLTGVAYHTSALIAKKLGAFEGFYENRQDMLRVIRNHQRAALGKTKVEDYEKLSIPPMAIDSSVCPDLAILYAGNRIWEQVVSVGEEYGFRNAQVTVLAPTGTIGLLLDCDTTGIEPDFALVKFKKLIGGGYFKIINQAIPQALQHLQYTDSQIKDICNYISGHKDLHHAPHINTASLKSKGFGQAQFDAISQALVSAMDISMAFQPYILTEYFCCNTLGIAKEQLQQPQFSLLQHLGFTEAQILAANQYLCGNFTIENAPHIKDKDLSVFDCANVCGKMGTRYLKASSHIRMMAAAQSFISGAISKTINMPYHATIEDCKQAYLLSWQLGLKANALYRDGSKLSQPLSFSTALEEVEMEVDDLCCAKDYKQLMSKLHQIANSVHKPVKKGYQRQVSIQNHSVSLQTTECHGGNVREVSIKFHQENSSMQMFMDAFAQSISLGLQYGVPLEEYVRAFLSTEFQPAGIVYGHDKIKFCSSILDYIFRELAISYLDRHDLSHQDTNQPSRAQAHTSADSQLDEIARARAKGYESSACGSCGNFTLVRNGSCLKCLNCGDTTGCS